MTRANHYLPWLLVFALGAGPASQPTTAPSAGRDPSSLLAGMNRTPVAAPPPKSGDGTLFPEVTATYWWSKSKLPQIGNYMGMLPSAREVGVVYSLSSDHPIAQKARQAINSYGIDAKGYDWCVRDVAGCSYALLKLDGGRIMGICLVQANTSTGWQTKANAISQGGIAQDGGFRVGQIAFTMRQSGHWTAHTPGTFVRSQQVSPQHDDTYPAAMYIECDPFSWSMATNCQSRETFEACIAGQVKPGMTMREAYLAMRNYPLKRLKKSDGNEEWQWTKDETQTASRMVYSDSYGTSVSSWQQVSQKVAARATITDSRVESFEWVVGE